MKEVAQIGACIGREFSYELLAAVSPLRDNELQDALSQLVNANIIHRRGEPPNSVYIFKHALIQDTAHQTLLKSKKRQLHARIAVHLEKRFKDVVTIHPEILAQHHFQASNFSKACSYYLQAARLAFRRSLAKEAIAHATSGLRVSDDMPKSESTDGLRSDLYLTIGRAYIFAKGWGSPDSLKAFTQSKQLSEGIGDDQRLLESLYGLATFHLVGGDIRTSLIECENIRKLANKNDNIEWMMLGNSMPVVSSVYRGDFVGSSYYYREFLKFYDEEKHFSLVPKYGADRRMQTMGHFALSSYALGYPDKAHKLFDEVRSLINDKTDPFTLAATYTSLALLGLAERNAQTVLFNPEKILNITQEYGIGLYLGIGMANLGGGLALSGKRETGLENLRNGIKQVSETGSTIGITVWNVFLAEVLGSLGEISQGLRQIEKALVQVDELGEGYFESECPSEKMLNHMSRM